MPIELFGQSRPMVAFCHFVYHWILNEWLSVKEIDGLNIRAENRRYL